MFTIRHAISLPLVTLTLYNLLSRHPANSDVREGHMGPEDPLERQVKDIWRQVLDVQTVELNRPAWGLHDAIQPF